MHYFRDQGSTDYPGGLIGLELREFDKICSMLVAKSRFGKNQSYKGLISVTRF